MPEKKDRLAYKKKLYFFVKVIIFISVEKKQSIVINIMNIYLETTDTSCQSQNCQNILWNRGHNGLKADLGSKNIKKSDEKIYVTLWTQITSLY